MKHYSWIVLETISMHGQQHQHVLADISGYAIGTFTRALWELRGLGLIEPHWEPLDLTERGKIALAIYRGKRERARRRRLAA